jgi:hypothetical protein
MENDSSRACLGKTQGSNASSFLTGETDRAHEPTKIFEACRQNGAFVDFLPRKRNNLPRQAPDKSEIWNQGAVVCLHQVAVDLYNLLRRVLERQQRADNRAGGSPSDKIDTVHEPRLLLH